MTRAFLVDKDNTYSYGDLLATVNADNQYYPYYQTHNLFHYFVNLVKALSSGKDIVLLDADMNPSELHSLDGSIDLTKKIQAYVTPFSSLPDLIEKLRGSSSHLTIFTSGTTGQPKKVVHNLETLTRSVRVGEKYANNVWAYAYNPTHMAGLQVFFQAFENVNMLVNVFNMSRNDVYSQIERYGITHISATPTFYRLLLPFEKTFQSVQRITLGGEKSDSHLCEMLHRLFPQAKINNVYASTEAGSLFAAKGDYFQLPEGMREKLKVVDDELLIHRSLLGESSSFQFDGDYYHSGDLIDWVDKEKGLFRFRSRKNELVNVGGYKVNPGEIEDALLKIEGVKQALVYGKANSILGNVLCADVQLENGCNLTELDVRKALISQLQDFKIPRRIKFVETLSLTRTGKLKRL